MLERIYVEIGNLCNLSCSFCCKITRPPRQMSVQEFSDICQKVHKKTKYLYLHVMGEPLLHPELPAILQTAREYALPLCITTNGTLLQNAGHTLLDCADIVHKVSISLHAPEGNGQHADQAYLTSVVDFAKAAAQKGIYAVLRLWNQDSAQGQGANTQNEEIEAFLHIAFSGQWQARPKGYRLCQNIFLEYDGVFTWPTHSTAEPQEQGFCHALTSQLAVLADGTVVPCCLDANAQIALGNLFDASLEQILKSPRAVAMQKGLEQRKFVEPLCQSCTYARRFGRGVCKEKKHSV